MRAPKRCALVVLMAGALLCRCASRESYLKNPWASLDARYVSWEPTTDAVPAVDDRKLANEYLATSLRLWKEAGYRAYIYTRARQVGDRELELTAFHVIGDVVTQRTLVRLNPEELGSSGLNNRVQRTSVWHEIGHAVGAHDGGFPVATMDQLYERCRHDVLATHSDLRVRMHFDIFGFLQACGFTADDCDDCPAVSVQIVAKYDMPASWDLRRNLCVDFDGLATARGYRPDWNGGCSSCSCDSGPDFPRPEPPTPPPSPSSPSEYGGEALVDICRIDPTACPREKAPDGPWGDWGRWACKTLLMADCPSSPRPPDVRAPICVGKATPTESWQVAQARCERMNQAARRR